MRIKNDKQQKPNSSWGVIVRDSFAGWTCVGTFESRNTFAAELHRLEEAVNIAGKVGAIHSKLNLIHIKVGAIHIKLSTFVWKSDHVPGACL